MGKQAAGPSCPVLRGCNGPGDKLLQRSATASLAACCRVRTLLRRQLNLPNTTCISHVTWTICLQVGLKVLLDDKHVFNCSDNIHDAVYYSELGSSLAIFNASYTIDSLMLRYQDIDWRDVRNSECNAGSVAHASLVRENGTCAVHDAQNSRPSAGCWHLLLLSPTMCIVPGAERIPMPSTPMTE